MRGILETGPLGNVYSQLSKRWLDPGYVLGTLLGLGTVGVNKAATHHLKRTSQINLLFSGEVSLWEDTASMSYWGFFLANLCARHFFHLLLSIILREGLAACGNFAFEGLDNPLRASGSFLQG